MTAESADIDNSPTVQQTIARLNAAIADGLAKLAAIDDEALRVEHELTDLKQKRHDLAESKKD